MGRGRRVGPSTSRSGCSHQKKKKKNTRAISICSPLTPSHIGAAPATAGDLALSPTAAALHPLSIPQVGRHRASLPALGRGATDRAGQARSTPSPRASSTAAPGEEPLRAAAHLVPSSPLRAARRGARQAKVRKRQPCGVEGGFFFQSDASRPAPSGGRFFFFFLYSGTGEIEEHSITQAN